MFVHLMQRPVATQRGMLLLGIVDRKNGTITPPQSEVPTDIYSISLSKNSNIIFKWNLETTHPRRTTTAAAPTAVSLIPHTILGAVHPQWVSINNAVYVCYNCSGLHRGFGVQISFIRSLSMDAISDKQYKTLEMGGNKRFAEFMGRYRLGEEPSKVKYRTHAAEYYRQMVPAGSHCNLAEIGD